MKKIFKVADIHALSQRVAKGEITFGRMVEIMNEKAFEAYSDTQVQEKTDIETVYKWEFDRSEAISMMQSGKKMTHKYFTENEWMIIGSDGLICFEDGVKCSLKEFFTDRTGTAWEDGYSLFNESQVKQ